MIRHRWFPPEEWGWLQSVIPITCVDVLPVRFSRRGGLRKIFAIGLIFRETPNLGKRWCLIGGRLCYGESLLQGVRRQVRETLGSHARPLLRATQQPVHVAEYSPSGRSPFALDPRQHSIGLTYALEVQGRTSPAGEALKFEWFELDKIPRSADFGFGQDRVVGACIKILRSHSSRAK
jgi:ADP-ribose pyrophosphatase YjhB (NUDIX family)